MKVRVIPEGRLVLIFDWNTNFFTLQFQIVQFADPAPSDIVSSHTSKGEDVPGLWSAPSVGVVGERCFDCHLEKPCEEAFPAGISMYMSMLLGSSACSTFSSWFSTAFIVVSVNARRPVSPARYLQSSIHLESEKLTEELENFLEEGIKSALPFLGVLNNVDLSTQKLFSVSIECAIHQASDESA
jgi:hypothetical protein